MMFFFSRYIKQKKHQKTSMQYLKSPVLLTYKKNMHVDVWPKPASVFVVWVDYTPYIYLDSDRVGSLHCG